jgi:hypothetical protein
MNLIILNSLYMGAIKVAPRWPYSEVHVSVKALKQLEFAQAKLDSGIRLVLTRGFEPGNLVTRSMYKVLRKLGGLIFAGIFPGRSSERSEIFSSNGHDVDGTHVDISIEQSGRVHNFLPLGVFSTHSSVKRAKESNYALLQKVQRALIECGFVIHRNPTESLQIHCDLISSSDPAAEQIGAHDSRLVVENM